MNRTNITTRELLERRAQGLLVLEARDLNHAIQLISKHPGVRLGPFEIRPAADLTEMIRESGKDARSQGRGRVRNRIQTRNQTYNHEILKHL